MLTVGTANMTPASSPMQMSMAGMPMNQVAMQLARYPSYPGLAFGGSPASASPFLGVPGLQSNIANNYPGYPSDPNLSLGYGLGLGGYPGNPQSNFMYGNPMYGNPQLGNVNGNGFGPQPGVDNFAALNNIINMANAQGLGAAPTGLYPQAGIGGVAGIGGIGGGAGVGGVGMPIPGYFGGHGVGLDGGMNIHNYAPAF